MADRTKILLPLIILLVGAVATYALVVSRPDVERTPPEITLPTVRTLEVQPMDVPVVVRSQGTVTPRTETQLVAEVAGTIERVRDEFESGAFIRRGEPLVWIDRRDYEAALTSQRAALAQAEVALEREAAEADVAREEWQALGREEAPSPLVLRQPQLREAEARVAAARAAVERAEIDLERTVIRAPFTGRLRSTSVDLGGFVSRGNPVATMYSVHDAQVRLPVPNGELAFLDVPERGESGGPRVTLSTEFAGAVHTWEGRIVRSEGEIDPRTRMVHLVAQVADPYGLDTDVSAPLAVGLFVDAAIEGTTISNAFRIPRAALRRDGTVQVVEGDRLTMRDVGIVRSTADALIVDRGLQPGDLVVVSRLDVATEGMRVDPLPAETPPSFLMDEAPTRVLGEMDPDAGVAIEPPAPPDTEPATPESDDGDVEEGP